MRTLLASVLVLSLVSCGTKETVKPDILPTLPVRLAAGSGAGHPGWVAATLNATQRAMLSTRMAASVKKVHVSEGDRVAAGSLLVSLSDDDLQGGLRAAESGLAAATAHHRRIEALARLGASTASEFEMAQTQVAQAQAGVAGMKANLAYTQIRAPFGGTVQARRVNEGDFVGPGAPLVELEGTGSLEWVASVSEDEARSLKMGQKITFDVDGKSGTAQISALSTGGDPVSHRGTLRARVLKGAEGLRTGSFGRLQVGAGTRTEDVTVPRSALVVRGELTGVFIAREGRAELRWLSLGETRGERVIVRAGLRSGEAVIDQPGTLKDGQPIEVKS